MKPYDLNSTDIVTPTTARLILLGLFAEEGLLVKIKTSYYARIGSAAIKDWYNTREVVFSIEGDSSHREISVKMNDQGNVSKQDVVNAFIWNQ